jgi:hypothetical protein
MEREAIKKRDECGRQRDKALREKEDVDLAKSNKVRDEVSKERDEIAKQFNEAVKERDGLKSEIGYYNHMLVLFKVYGTQKKCIHPSINWKFPTGNLFFFFFLTWYYLI